MGDFSISSEDGDDADTYVNEASRHIIANIAYALIAVDRARFYHLKSQSDLRILVKIFEPKLLEKYICDYSCVIQVSLHATFVVQLAKN